MELHYRKKSQYTEKPQRKKRDCVRARNLSLLHFPPLKRNCSLKITKDLLVNT